MNEEHLHNFFKNKQIPYLGMKDIIEQLDKNFNLSISTSHEKTTQRIKDKKFKETGYKTLMERLTNELESITP